MKQNNALKKKKSRASFQALSTRKTNLLESLTL